VKREESKQRSRQKIIEATVHALAQLGWEATTFAGIAEGAGVSRGLITFHFETREKLFLEVFNHLRAKYWELHANAAGDDSNAWDHLKAIARVDFHPAIWNRDAIMVWQIFRTQAQSSPQIQRTLKELDRRALQGCIDLVKDVADERGARGVDSEQVAMVWFALVLGMRTDYLTSPQRFSRRQAEAVLLGYLSTAIPQSS